MVLMLTTTMELAVRAMRLGTFPEDRKAEVRALWERIGFVDGYHPIGGVSVEDVLELGSFVGVEFTQ
jgi:hypothetical protein